MKSSSILENFIIHLFFGQGAMVHNYCNLSGNGDGGDTAFEQTKWWLNYLQKADAFLLIYKRVWRHQPSGIQVTSCYQAFVLHIDMSIRCATHLQGLIQLSQMFQMRSIDHSSCWMCAAWLFLRSKQFDDQQQHGSTTTWILAAREVSSAAVALVSVGKVVELHF